jgi:hypothetical protein
MMVNPNHRTFNCDEMMTVNCPGSALAAKMDNLKGSCQVVHFVSQKGIRQQKISKECRTFVNRLAESADTTTSSSGDSRSLEFENCDDVSTLPMKI